MSALSLATRRPSLAAVRLGGRAPLAVLLTLTAVLYLWGLDRSGYANEFYAAAVKAGTQSWKAFGGPGGGGPRGGNSEIASWVASTFTGTSVGGATVYETRSLSRFRIG
jgi:hypothetical protein